MLLAYRETACDWYTLVPLKKIGTTLQQLNKFLIDHRELNADILGKLFRDNTVYHYNRGGTTDEYMEQNGTVSQQKTGTPVSYVWMCTIEKDDVKVYIPWSATVNALDQIFSPPDRSVAVFARGDTSHTTVNAVLKAIYRFLETNTNEIKTYAAQHKDETRDALLRSSRRKNAHATSQQT